MKAGLSREDVFVHRGGLLALFEQGRCVCPSRWIISITQIEEERMKAGLSREDVFVHRGGLLALLRLRKKG